MEIDCEEDDAEEEEEKDVEDEPIDDVCFYCLLVEIKKLLYLT